MVSPRPSIIPLLVRVVGARGLHVVEHLEADVILALAADLLLEPGDGLDVVIEDLGAGGEDRDRRSRSGR